MEAAFNLVNPTEETWILVAEGTYKTQPLGGSFTSFTFNPAWQKVRVSGGFLGVQGGSTNVNTPDGNPALTVLGGTTPGINPPEPVVSFMDGPGSTGMNTVSLENCVVTGGRGAVGNSCGGGIFVSTQAEVTLKNVTVLDNWATLGGGIYIGQGQGQPMSSDMTGVVISNCTVRENHARDGAGI